MASIKDGRYSEQSYRLNGFNHHNHNIVYLIEGTVPKNSKDRQTIFSSMLSINYYKGFSVMRSTSMEETAYIVCNAFNKIRKESDKGKKAFYMSESETKSDPEISYSSVIKSKKNANITPQNFGEIALCQIPSINTVSAVAIMKEFKTLHSLMSALRENPKCLDDVTYETEKKQVRKISKTVVKNIVEFLL